MDCAINSRHTASARAGGTPFSAARDFTFVSTAGGAFLEWMEGKPLPGVDALKA